MPLIPVGDELFEQVRAILTRAYFDFNLPQPGDTAMDVQATSWHGHFQKKGVPWDVVPQLYDAALTTKAGNGSGSFMPTVAELLHEWDKVLDDGYWTKQNEPQPDERIPALPKGSAPLDNADTTDAPAFVKQFQAFTKRTGGPVVCKCNGDRFSYGGKRTAKLSEAGGIYYWECADGSCDFHVLSSDLGKLATEAAARPAPKEAPAPVHAPVVESKAGFSKFLQEIAKDCNIDLLACTSQLVADLRAFGVWWCKTHKGRLTPDLLAEYYPQWQAEREAAKSEAAA